MNGKRLNELTPAERKVVFVPGAVLSYSDAANPYGKFIVKEVDSAEVCLTDEENYLHYLSLGGGFQHGWKVVRVAV